jgi:hypothetical protein
LSLQPKIRPRTAGVKIQDRIVIVGNRRDANQSINKSDGGRL